MMTITSSMMMMMSCLIDPVGAEVANQSNSGMRHSATLGSWVCRAGCGAGGRVKCRFASSALFSEPPRSCLFLLCLLRYESHCATGIDPGHRLPSY